jgi:hypothetical protein
MKAHWATKALAAIALPASLLIAGGATAAASASPGTQTAQLTVRHVLNGMNLHHSFTPPGGGKRTEPLTQPDDITAIGLDLFTAFQNGVGSQGEPSSDGNTDSTIVEFSLSGQVLGQWDLKGKVDGLTADPARNIVIATVNEDLNSSLYTIEATPRTAAVQHYTYNKPLPHNGGTDAISIVGGQIVVSASAPGTIGKPAPQPAYPAAYTVTLRRSHVAAVAPVFFDEAQATVANTGPSHGKRVRLALTDPDSNSVVPAFASRFAGDFMPTSQADKQQIFAQRTAAGDLKLQVLNLSQSVDDTAWSGAANELLFATDATADFVDVVTGQFAPRSVITAVTPCDAANAPATCPAPGFPPNYLGSLNPRTGHVSHLTLTGPRLEPKGLVFIAPPA